MNDSSSWLYDSGLASRFSSDPTLTTAVYRKDAIIYRQGNQNEFLYYIIEGRVRVTMLNTGGEEKILAVLDAGSFVNENGFLLNIHSPATAQALSEVKLVKISQKDFQRIAAMDTGFVLKMMNSMCLKIRMLTFQVEYLSFFDNQTKLAIVIRGLATDYGELDENGVTVVDLPTTDQELGNFLGVRREAVTKILSKFKADGILDKKNRKLQIFDMAALEEMIARGVR